jgi:hypothetical protein
MEASHIDELRLETLSDVGLDSPTGLEGDAEPYEPWTRPVEDQELCKSIKTT